MTFWWSLISNSFQGSSEDLRDRRSFKNLRKIFEIKFHSKIIGRSSRSKVIQGTPDVLHDRRSFKDLGKFFEANDSSKTFENSSRSKMVRGPLDNRDQRPMKTFGRYSRSKVIQGPSESFWYQRTIEDLRKLLKSKIEQCWSSRETWVESYYNYYKLSSVHWAEKFL